MTTPSDDKDDDESRMSTGSTQPLLYAPLRFALARSLKAASPFQSIVRRLLTFCLPRHGRWPSNRQELSCQRRTTRRSASWQSVVNSVINLRRSTVVDNIVTVDVPWKQTKRTNSAIGTEFQRKLTLSLEIGLPEFFYNIVRTSRGYVKIGSV